MIRAYTANVKVGDICFSTVVKSTDFGLFIELKPGVDGLCHITQLAEEQVESV